MRDFKMKSLKQKQNSIFDQMKNNLRRRKPHLFDDKNLFEKYLWNNKMQQK